jgi:hypothetical protein
VGPVNIALEARPGRRPQTGKTVHFQLAFLAMAAEVTAQVPADGTGAESILAILE